jgi:hypothetical protein
VPIVYAKRRRKHRFRLWHRLTDVRWLIPGAALAVCAVGFTHESLVAIYRQEHGPPGAEHPWDFRAEFFLAAALLILAVMALGRVNKPIQRRKARPRLIRPPERAKSAKGRPGSG